MLLWSAIQSNGLSLDFSNFISWFFVQKRSGRTDRVLRPSPLFQKLKIATTGNLKMTETD